MCYVNDAIGLQQGHSAERELTREWHVIRLFFFRYAAIDCAIGQYYSPTIGDREEVLDSQAMNSNPVQALQEEVTENILFSRNPFLWLQQCRVH